LLQNEVVTLSVPQPEDVLPTNRKGILKSGKLFNCDKNFWKNLCQ